MDTEYLATEMKAETTDEVKNPLQDAKKSSIIVAFKGCLGIIFIYRLLYIYFHICKTKLNLTHCTVVI